MSVSWVAFCSAVPSNTTEYFLDSELVFTAVSTKINDPAENVRSRLSHALPVSDRFSQDTYIITEILKGPKLPDNAVVYLHGIPEDVPSQFILNQTRVYFAKSVTPFGNSKYNISLYERASTWYGPCLVNEFRTGELGSCDGKPCDDNGHKTENGDKWDTKFNATACCSCQNADIHCRFGSCESNGGMNIVEIALIWTLVIATGGGFTAYLLNKRSALCFADQEHKESKESTGIQSGDVHDDSDDLVDLSTSSSLSDLS